MHCGKKKKKIIWTSTEKLSATSFGARQATVQLYTKCLLQQYLVQVFLIPKYLQTFRQLQFVFPWNCLQRLVTTMTEMEYSQSDLHYRIHFHKKAEDHRISHILIQKSIFNYIYVQKLRYITHSRLNINMYS